ncbi:MAG: amidohydrolase family protein [Verrucomicrobiales bacterium]|nr:amidohydrolase family protein [Verrucomicrobiales bacterium]
MNRVWISTFTLWMGCLLQSGQAAENLAIHGETVHTMAGPPLKDGVVLVQDGKITSVGAAASMRIPDGFKRLQARVVTPGLIDARTVVGLSGILNQPHDQEQMERSAPVQPELRAIDAYNSRDDLVDYVRSFGVTTLHTGHAPGSVISGQTMVVKTYPPSLDQALILPESMIAATLGGGSTSGEKGKSPGTRAKAMAMLRAELLKAQDYVRKQAVPDLEKRPARDLHLETLGRALSGKQPLLITVHRHQDILAALRLADEFKLKIVLDGVADAPLVIDAIKASGFPVVLHPTQFRSSGEAENLSMETASKLQAAGISFALQSGFETYVPKTRIVLLEAAVAAANGLTFDQALASITISAAKVLGLEQRLGSLEPGKDADLALYDGDPFEYTTHCIAVIVSGVQTDARPR